MKRVARMVAIAVMAMGLFSAFAGCGSATSPGEIVVLMNRTDLRTTVLADAKAQFDAEFAEQGWTVSFETSTDYEGDTTTRMLGGEYGDVLLIPNSVKGEEFSYYFMPLGSTEELGKEWRFVNSKAHDGQVYGLSTYGSTTGILYNKKVFEEAGVTEMPSTPDEFLSAMRTLKEANADNEKFVPYYTNFAAEWPLDQWTDAVIPATGNANYLVDELPWDTGAFAPGGACYTVYELLYDLVKEGLTEQSPSTTEWERSKVELVNGNIGAMVLGSWAIPQFQEVAGGKAPGDLVLQPGEITGSAEDIGYMPFPFEVDGKMYATSASDYTLGIANNTRNEAAARAFVEWFLTDFGYYKLCGGIPPHINMYHDIFKNTRIVVPRSCVKGTSAETLALEYGFGVGDWSIQVPGISSRPEGELVDKEITDRFYKTNPVALENHPYTMPLETYYDSVNLGHASWARLHSDPYLAKESEWTDKITLRLGYRFVFEEVNVSNLKSGGTAEIGFTLKNAGAAPNYRGGNPVFYLKDAEGKIVAEGASALDVRTLEVAETAADAPLKEGTASLKLPEGLSGKYSLCVAVCVDGEPFYNLPLDDGEDMVYKIGTIVFS